MSIKSDKWMRRMAENHDMIESYEPTQVKQDNGQSAEESDTSYKDHNCKYQGQSGVTLPKI